MRNKKIIAASLLIVATSMLIVSLLQFVPWDKLFAKNDLEPVIAAVNNNGDDVIDKVVDMPSTITLKTTNAEVSFDGSSSQFPVVITILRAIVKPDNVYYTDFSWSIRFKNSGNVWTIDKLPESYMSLQPSADGRSCSLILNDFFREPLIVTLESVSAGVRDECLIDFWKCCDNPDNSLCCELPSESYYAGLQQGFPFTLEKGRFGNAMGTGDSYSCPSFFSFHNFAIDQKLVSPYEIYYVIKFEQIQSVSFDLSFSVYNNSSLPYATFNLLPYNNVRYFLFSVSNKESYAFSSFSYKYLFECTNIASIKDHSYYVPSFVYVGTVPPVARNSEFCFNCNKILKMDKLNCLNCRELYVFWNKPMQVGGVD